MILLGSKTASKFPIVVKKSYLRAIKTLLLLSKVL